MSFSQGHALLIGVGTFADDSILDVEITADDVNKIAKVLQDPKVSGYPSEQVDVLIKNKATRKGIIKALQNLANQTSEDDTVFIFFSSHGTYDKEKKWHFVTHDAQFNPYENESLVDSKTALDGGTIIKLIRKIPARKKFIVFNTCHSAEVLRDLGADTERPEIDSVNPDKNFTYSLLQNGSGNVIITASGTSEKSYFKYSHENTIFASVFLESLHGKNVLSNNGYISAFNLYTTVHDRVKKLAQTEFKASQQPELTVLNVTGSMPISLYQGASDVGPFTSEETPQNPRAFRVNPTDAEQVYQNYFGDNSKPVVINEVTGDVKISQGDNVFGPKIEIHQHNKPPEPKTRTPNQVPKSPRHFVVPSSDFSKLKRMILDEKTNGESIAIIGTGGIGKTSLAIALGHDESIINAFPDGILWASLGPRGDVAGAQINWETELTTRAPTSVSPEHKFGRLKSLLSKKSCLIIIDDVWEQTSFKHLNVGGPQSVTIVTTRRLGLVKDGVKFKHQVSGLSEIEADDLLRNVSEDQDQTSKAKELRSKIAANLGYLPLALKLAASLHKGGISWELIHREIATDDIVDIKLLDEYESTEGLSNAAHDEFRDIWAARNKSLVNSLDFSLFHLEQAGKETNLSKKFLLLSVFDAGREAPFSEEAIITVWSILEQKTNTVQIKKALIKLIDSALLEKNENGQYFIHHVVGSYARQTLVIDHEELIINAIQAHHDFYFNMVKEATQHWQNTETALPQIRRAWNRLDDQEAIKLLYQWPTRMSQFLTRRGHWGVLFEWAQKLSASAKEAKKENYQAWGEYYLGLYYFEHLKKFDNSLVHFEKANSLFESTQDKFGKAVALTNIGLIYNQQNEYDKALHMFNDSLQKQREISNHEGIATNLNNIGLIYAKRGDTEKALKMFEEGLILQKEEEIADKGDHAYLHFSIAGILKHEGKFHEAAKKYKFCLKIWRKTGDRKGEALALNELGNIHIQLEKIEDSKNYFEKGLKIWMELNDKIHIGSIYHVLGKIHSLKGEYEQSVEMLEGSIGIWKELGVATEEANSRTLLGEIFFNQNDSENGAKQMALAKELLIPNPA